ncbi:MAG: hypothetical protein ABWJ42_04205 [Sulfolobales archaeon]
MILITTSRRTTRRTNSFVKELWRLIPSDRLTRGKLSIKGLAAEALIRGINKFLVINTLKGNPSSIDLYRIVFPQKLDTSTLPSEGNIKVLRVCRIVFRGVSLSRELRHKICSRDVVYSIDSTNCRSDACNKLAEILEEIFPIARDVSDRERQIIFLEEMSEKNVIIMSMKNHRNESCGPLIRVSKIILFNQELVL